MGRPSAWIILIVAVFAVGLAGCGKKGSPEPPPGEKSEYPRTYPAR